MKLPLKYTETMKALLGEEYDAYLASFDEERFYGLRVNTLKLSAEEMAARGVFSLRPVPWCETGFYYDGAERPAKHPYYHAGLYYLQEPSAMSPAATLPIGEGDRVLDLCAAPGGKTTQLGARLGGTGLLVANDISAGRAKTLLKNVELAGIRNAIVMSETPERIAERLPHFFDKILVDAPCSGEGMFRKEPDMVKSWDAEMLAFCRSEQAKILEACAPMLKAGGMLLYSTCTQDYTNNEKAMNEIASSDYKSDFLGGQNHIALFAEAATKIDMSNAGPYDQGLNESFQNAFKDYFTGNVEEDAAKANFETAIKEKYPELTDVVWPA